jgi:hypothetical protein
VTPDTNYFCCKNDSPDTGTYTEGAAKDPQDSALNYNSNDIPIPARHELHAIGDAWCSHLQQPSSEVVLQMDYLDDALVFGIRLSALIKAKQFEDTCTHT